MKLCPLICGAGIPAQEEGFEEQVTTILLTETVVAI